MTKPELSTELRKLIDRSGLNVTLTLTIGEGDDTFAKMLHAGANPPRPANPFDMDELRKLLAQAESFEEPPSLDMGVQLVP